MLALVRANHHMTHISHLEDLLRSILADTCALNASAAASSWPTRKPASSPARRRSPPSAPGPDPPVQQDAGPSAASAWANRSCATTSTPTKALVLARSVRHGRHGVRHLLRCCARRANASASCTWTAASSMSRSPRTTSTTPTPSPPASPSASRPPSWSSSSASSSSRPSPPWPRPSRCATSTPAITRAASPTTRCCWPKNSKLSPNEKYQIQIGTPLHDIGKIGIDDAILRKPGKLTAGEFEVMKTHTTKGADDPRTMVAPGADDPDRPSSPRTLGRHRLSRRPDARPDSADGPHRRRRRRLRRHDVATARIARPCPPTAAFLELIDKAGTHFDPNCVYAFMRLRRRSKSVYRHAKPQDAAQRFLGDALIFVSKAPPAPAAQNQRLPPATAPPPAAH